MISCTTILSGFSLCFGIFITHAMTYKIKFILDKANELQILMHKTQVLLLSYLHANTNHNDSWLISKETLYIYVNLKQLQSFLNVFISSKISISNEQLLSTLKSYKVSIEQIIEQNDHSQINNWINLNQQSYHDLIKQLDHEITSIISFNYLIFILFEYPKSGCKKLKHLLMVKVKRVLINILP